MRDDDNLKPGDVPLCRDCRWCWPWWRAVRPLQHEDMCAHRGVNIPCGVERKHGLMCGPSGKLFEPRRSWWQRLRDRWQQRNELDRLKGEIARTK